MLNRCKLMFWSEDISRFLKHQRQILVLLDFWALSFWPHLLVKAGNGLEHLQRVLVSRMRISHTSASNVKMGATKTQRMYAIVMWAITTLTLIQILIEIVDMNHYLRPDHSSWTFWLCSLRLPFCRAFHFVIFPYQPNFQPYFDELWLAKWSFTALSNLLRGGQLWKDWVSSSIFCF